MSSKMVPKYVNWFFHSVGTGDQEGEGRANAPYLGVYPSLKHSSGMQERGFTSTVLPRWDCSL